MEDELKFLEKFYVSVINDKSLLKSHLQKKELASLSIDVQEKILHITVQNPLVKKYPPPITFQKFFLRTVLDAVESSGSELSDNFIEVYANLLSQPSNSDCTYRTYIIKDDCVVTLQESSCFVANSTTGLQTWEASKYLLEWCLENDSLFQSKRILELGSGIGLLGIAVIKLCKPQKYLFSDKSWDVLNMLSKNIAINFEDSVVKQVIEKHQLSWGALCPEDILELAVDVLLGADIVFDPSTIQSLVETLKEFLDRGTAKCAYIACTIRNAETNACFITHLDSAKLNYEILDCQKKCIFIYNAASNFILYKIFSQK